MQRKIISCGHLSPSSMNLFQAVEDLCNVFCYSLKFLTITHVMMTAIPLCALVYRHDFKRPLQMVQTCAGLVSHHH